MGTFTDFFGVSAVPEPEKLAAETEESEDVPRELIGGYDPNEVTLQYIQILESDAGVLYTLTAGCRFHYTFGSLLRDGSGRVEHERITISHPDKAVVDAVADKIRALSQMRYDEWLERSQAEVTKLEAYMTSEAWLEHK